MYIPPFPNTDEITSLVAESNQKIIPVMQRNPYVTIRKLQEETGLSESGVKKEIRLLRAEGVVQRIGGTKGGHWEVRSV